MNKIITSKEAILKVSRDLVKEQGWNSVNIRTVANVSGISVGSIYNYFGSKSELIAFTIESIWRDIFHFTNDKTITHDLILCIDWIFDSMKKGNEKYPDFFTLHSMSFWGEDKTIGRELRQKAWKHIKESLIVVLSNDKKVRENAFDKQFTKVQFVDILFSLIFTALLQQKYDCSSIKELIYRLIY